MQLIEVIHKSFTELPDAKGVLRPYTHIVYKDEEGMIGTITIEKKDPTDADIAAAIKKQREEEAKRKPYIIKV